MLIGTSLSDESFQVCLRLCLFEGVFNQSAVDSNETSVAHDYQNTEVRCHSIYISQDESGPPVLPNRQYSVIQHGPWILFMLWHMRSNGFDNTSPEAPPLEALTPCSLPAKLVSLGSDPFGVDLCLDLLASLPLPLQTQDGALPGAPATIGGSAGSAPSAGTTINGSTAAGRGQKKNRTFSLPCPVWKTLSRSRPVRQKSDHGSRIRPVEPFRPFMHTLALRGVPAATSPAEVVHGTHPGTPEADKTAALALQSQHGFGALREPGHAARDQFPGTSRLQCPEMAPRAALRPVSAWGGNRSTLNDWSELESLAREHGSRHVAWANAPSHRLTSHALVGALRNKGAMESLLDECLDGNTPAESSSNQTGNDSTSHRRPKAATTLGRGDLWRFQVGAPFLLSDVSPAVSAGALVRSGARRSWKAMSAVHPHGDGEAEPAAHSVLLQMDDQHPEDDLASPKSAISDDLLSWYSSDSRGHGRIKEADAE